MRKRRRKALRDDLRGKSVIMSDLRPPFFLACLHCFSLSQKNRFRFRTSHSLSSSSAAPLISCHFLLQTARRTIRSLPRSSKDPLKGGRVCKATAIPPPAAATLCAPKGAPSDGRASRAVKAQAIAIAHAGAPPLLPRTVDGTFGLFYLKYGKYFAHSYRPFLSHPLSASGEQ